MRACKGGLGKAEFSVLENGEEVQPYLLGAYQRACLFQCKGLTTSLSAWRDVTVTGTPVNNSPCEAATGTHRGR